MYVPAVILHLIKTVRNRYALVRLPAMIHGIGLLLILVSGFGMQAKLKLGFPVWMISKLVILLALGGSIALIKRKALPPVAIYFLVIFLGSIAAYLGFSNSMVLRP